MIKPVIEIIPVESILLTIPKLSPRDLKKIKDRVDVALSIEKKSSDEDVIKEDYLLAGILTVLASKGLGKTLPFGVRLRSALPKDFVDNSRTIQLFLESHIKRMGKAEKILLGRLCAQALAHSISSYKPVMFKTMVQSVLEIPEALEKAYPGYIEAGMLDKLLKRVL